MSSVKLERGRVPWYKYDTCKTCSVGPGEKCLDRRQKQVTGRPRQADRPHPGRLMVKK